MKRCPDCGELKGLHAFGLHKGRRDGRQFYCRICTGLRRRKYPDSAYKRRWRIKHEWGLTEAEYDAIIADGCAICGHVGPAGPTGLHLDHDHRTGRIRGALCQRHNHGIGLFEDRPELLEAAAKYLHNAKATA